MKKFSAVVLSAVLLFSSVIFCVNANGGESARGAELKPFYSLQTKSSREMLSAPEKEIFDAVSCCEPGKTELIFSTLLGESITYELFSSINLERLFFAVLKDCPHLFWIEGMSLTYENLCDNNSNGVFDIGDTVTAKLSLPRNTAYDSVFDTYSYIASVVASKDFSLCNTRFELLLAVHDFVADSISLNDAAEGDECVSNEANDPAHNVVGALYGGFAACEGYAKAFKLFCDYLKIPCVTLNDGEHMWNGVLMDDGNWYFVDVSGDDIDDERSYGCFLVGTDSPDALNPESIFCETHAVLSDSATPEIVFSGEAYAVPASGAYSGFSSTVNSNADNNTRLFKRSVYQKEEPIYFNGIAVNFDFNATGDKFTVRSGASFSDEEWTLVLLGDVNGDGVCDSADYTLLKTRVLSGESGLVNGAFDAAGDMNCDGFLDVIDISMLERCVSGANRNIEIG